MADMPGLPTGYASVNVWPSVTRKPQPPARQPMPPNPHLLNPPVTKTGAPAQPPLIARPIIQVFHSIFG